jgi:ABC-2 type transport system permease protein
MFDDDNNWQYDNALRAGLTAGRLPARLAERLLHPEAGNGPTVYEWNPEARSFKPAQGGVGADLGKFAVPYAFSMLLLMSIFTGTGYLVYGLVEEKENRLMEVLLSSASHEEILRGKLIGLGAAGLTQIGVWALFGGVPAAIVLALSPSAPHISPVTALIALMLFALGFALYGTIMAGVGSLGTSWRESQQATAMITFLAVIPLMMMPVFMADPNGTVARVLSWFPLTSPIAMMLRVGMTAVPAWDLALGIALVAVGVWLAQKMSAKLFRLGLLMYGKAPSLPEVWRWMVRA